MPVQHKNRFRLFPLLTLSAFLSPVVLGLVGTWLPAFGYLPAIGAERLSCDHFRELFSYPGFPGALQSTLLSGVGAALTALGLSLWLTMLLYGSWPWRLLLRLLPPLLAVPHAAFAIGFAFLVAPSGWVIRWLSPWLTGFEVPPDWLTVKDEYGISLMAVLVCKEVPFLLLMCVSGLNQLDVRRTIWVGRSLGYSPVRIWFRLILPQLYPQLRLPVLAVLAYSLSVVDIAMIVGPSIPPTLSVLIDRWFNDPDLQYRLLGAAGATWLFVMVGCGAAVFLFGEKLVGLLSAKRMLNGCRTSALDNFSWSATLAVWLFFAVSLLSFAVLVVWSFTQSWRFPDMLPSTFSQRFWIKGAGQAAGPLLDTALIGGAAALIGIVLVIGCLENEVYLRRSGRKVAHRNIMWLVYLPLLIPQIAFLFGIQTAALVFHLEGTWVGMVAVHLIFVLPYIFLSLSGGYRKYDERYTLVAGGLSSSFYRSFFRVKLVMLLKPIAFSLAIGFGVSVAQYLPTLYLGAGRFSTITTETVSLAGGADRRIVAVYALFQFLLPCIVYGLALLVPAWFFRNRKGMQN